MRNETFKDMIENILDVWLDNDFCNIFSNILDKSSDIRLSDIQKYCNNIVYSSIHYFFEIEIDNSYILK